VAGEVPTYPPSLGTDAAVGLTAVAPAASVGFDAGADDGTVSMMTPLFRPIMPLSTALATSRTPTFAWTDLDGADYFLADVCLDRRCDRQVAALASGLTSVSVDQALDPGVYFWRVRAHLMTGGFATSVTWELFVGRKSAPQDCSQLARPDVDGDGLSDVVISGDGPVEQYSFARGGVPRGVPALVAAGATSLTYAADLDGDGYGDVAVGRQGAVNVYRGGPGGLQPGPAITGSADFGSSVTGVGDVDGDGYGDLLIGAQGVSLLFHGGPAGLRSDGASVPGAGAMAAGDVNGDGFADVLACGGGPAQVFFGSGAGLRPGPTLAAAASACSGVGDRDGDGFGDVVVAGPEGTFVYLGGPDNTLRRSESLMVAGASAVAGAGDVDGDGLADFVVVGPAGSRVFSSGGAPLTLPGGTAGGIGDVDGDGFDDLVVAPAGCASPAQIFAGHAGGLSDEPFYTFPPTRSCARALLAR
jgi:hypothetical protein